MGKNNDRTLVDEEIVRKDNNLPVTVIVCVTILLMFVSIGWYAHYEQNKNYLRVAEFLKTPGIYHSDSEQLFMLGTSLILDGVKEIEIDCSQDGIKGDSLVKGYNEEKILVKEDVNCIDKYTYKKVSLTTDILTLQIWEDSGCRLINLSTTGAGGAFYRCPQNNCKEKEIVNKVGKYDNIFDYVKLTEIGGAKCKIKLVMKE